jgi:hypothetical protein
MEEFSSTAAEASDLAFLLPQWCGFSNLAGVTVADQQYGEWFPVK